MLKELPGLLGSDYINASWINVNQYISYILHSYDQMFWYICRVLSTPMPTLQLKVIAVLYELEIIIILAGPKPSTVGGFWRMVWQYKVTHIVMVTGVCEAGKVSLLCVNSRKGSVLCNGEFSS